MSTLLYDGNCGFCKVWIHYWRQITGDRVQYASSQERGGEFPRVPTQTFSEAVVLVEDDGTFSSGAAAVFETLGKGWIYGLFPALWEFLYRLIARNRSFFYQVTRFTFGRQIEVDRFARTQNLFMIALGLIYAVAFASFAVQVTGLIGKDGILPAQDFFDSLRKAYGNQAYVLVPSLLWVNASDIALKGACWLGIALSVAVVVGQERRVALPALYILYLALSLAGQTFMGFQWDALLLEAGFLAIFFGTTDRQQRIFAWMNRLLLFKLYFLSGWVKLASGDRSWHDRTALAYHFETQPLPTPLAWYVHQFPAGVTRAMTSATLGIELLLPFFLFAPRLWRMTAATVMVALQVVIFLTGNYTFFNLLTVAIALFAFDDRVWERVFRLPALAFAPKPTIRGVMGGTWLLIFLSAFNAMRLYENTRGDLPGPIRGLADVLWPFQISNSYGLFAVMTRSRPEIVVEGSADGEHWLAYEFRYKPGDLNQAPRWVAPHQPRLDWQMWFAALDTYRSSPWFAAFAEKLLEGSPDVRALLAKDPFAGTKPKFVRARLFDYHFTRYGQAGWWTREPRGDYFPEVGLKSGPN